MKKRNIIKYNLKTWGLLVLSALMASIGSSGITKNYEKIKNLKKNYEEVSEYYKEKKYLKEIKKIKENYDYSERVEKNIISKKNLEEKIMKTDSTIKSFERLPQIIEYRKINNSDIFYFLLIPTSIFSLYKGIKNESKKYKKNEEK